MKSMKQILAEFREYSQKVNSLEKIIESRKTRAQRLEEDRELFSEISRQSAEKIYDWMRETDGMPYDFEDLFDGAMRVYFPLASDEQRNLVKIVRTLSEAGWEVPRIDGMFPGVPPRRFEVKKVKQKRQRLQADGGGEYEVEIDVADLRLVRTTEKVIPAGPRKGEKVEKKEDTSMSKAIARLVKSGALDADLLEWWQSKQVLYTKDHQHKQIERAFEGDEASDYTVVVSRHPIDVLRMSDVANIRSCHSEGSEYFHCAIAEAKGHGPIAYIVQTEDLENHLMDQEEDLDPTQTLGRAMNSLDRDEFREKMAKEFDLESPAGRWVYIETWAETVDGDKWLKELQQRIDMASHPEKFKGQFMNSKAKQLGVPMEDLAFYYRVWLRGETDIRPVRVKTAEYEKARKAVYNKETAPRDLKPISDFDNQEIFRDRDRNIQGIGARARVRLRKFEEPMRFGTFAVPEHRVYGHNIPGFVDAVRKWATDGQRDQFIGDTGEIEYPRFEDMTRRGGSYEDNRDGETLNNFFQEMQGKEWSDPDWDPPYNEAYNVGNDPDDEEDEDDSRFEEYSDRVEQLNAHANNTLEHASCHAEVEDMGDGTPYVYASADVSYRIPLPWRHIDSDADGDWVHIGEDGEPVEDSGYIPRSWGGDWARRNAFESALTDMLDYYPEETEWEVVKYNDQVYLNVRHIFRMEDGTEPDDYDSFIDYVESDIDHNYRENKEKIRKSLVESEYIDPNDWDNLQDDISEMEETLKNWGVFGVGDDDGEVVFSLRTGGAYPQGRNHMKTGIRWPYNSTSRLSNTETLKGLFGGETKVFGIERYLSLNSGSPGTVLAKGGVLFKRAFRTLQDAANEYARRQLTLNFGPEYEEKYTPIEMGKNVELGIMLVDPSDTYTGSDGALELGFTMKVRVYSEDRSDEIEAAFNFVKYVDSNMAALKEAVVNAFASEVMAWEEQRKADLRAQVDGTGLKQQIKRVRLQNDTGADNGFEAPIAAMKVVRWAEQNFEKMKADVEKITITLLMRKIAEGRDGHTYASQLWDEMASLPHGWTEAVRLTMVQQGASFSQKESYNGSYLAGVPEEDTYSQEGDKEPTTLSGTLGEPQPAFGADEMKEEIYKRLQKKILKKKVKSHIIEKLEQKKELQREQVRQYVKSKLQELDTGYTQRTYKMNLRIAMAKEHGGKRDETENEVRGILNVTTVKILAGTTRQDGGNYYADVMIKFVLLGQDSVTQYIEKVLKPGLKKIEGLQILRVDNWEEITSARLAEYIGIPGEIGQDRISPTPTVDQIVQNWSMTGTDRANSAIDNELAHQTREVTMMPVDELMQYVSSPGNFFSGTKTEFDDLKQKIIGGYHVEPVMVGIGKNGRAKVLKGDDLILVAKDIGLKELPTVFSLQYQV